MESKKSHKLHSKRNHLKHEIIMGADNATQEENPIDQKLNEDFYSNKHFKDLMLTEYTLKALENKNYTIASEIQAKCIPQAIKGKDIMGTAKTGSGKSLAFLIPAVELLFKTDFNQMQGTGIIVITPTRELATQLYDAAKDLLVFKKKTCCTIIGGAYRKKEARKLVKGVNLLIATPGRLLDHLKNTDGFNYLNLCMLIIDEADAILKIGFEDEMKEILKILPKERQTMLFSATLSKKVENLISLSLKNPIHINIKNKLKTVANLEHGYIVVEPDKKFLFLYSFIKNNPTKKIMVFFATCMEVQFYSYLLNYVDVPVKDIHGDLKQIKRNQVYYEFFTSDNGVLLCTDIAQRGLDFPDVDWIVQYDPPNNPEDYLHRVGRTARGADASGKALLILMPNEVKFIQYIKNFEIDNLKEFEFSEDKIIQIQSKFEKIVSTNPALERLAVDAYKSLIYFYLYSKLQNVFDVNELDTHKVCKSFGCLEPPRVFIKNQNISK